MKNNYYFLVLCYFFIGCHRQNPLDEQLSHSIQRLSDCNRNKTSDTLILRGTLDTAYQIASKIAHLQHDSLFAAVSRLYGNALYNIDGTKALIIYQKGLSIGLRQLPLTDNVIFRLYNNTAQLYYNQNDYKTALTYFDSVKINSQAPDAQNVKLNFMNMIAECYMYLNDPISSVRVISDIEPMAHKLYSQEQLIPFYTKYAEYLRLQKKYAEAAQKVNLGESIIQNLKKEKVLTTEDSTSWADNAFEQAHIYHKSKDFQRSEHYYLEALHIYDEQHNLQNYLYTLRNLGNMYFLSKQFDKAEQVLTKGLKICNQSEFDDATIRLKFGLLDNRSEVYLETKQYQKAIADHDSAIYYFTLYEKKPSLTAVMMQARPVLLSVLSDKAKANIALAENGSDTEGYTKALKLTDDIIQLTDDIRADYFSDDAKLTLANDIKPALEKAIGVCQKLYQKTQDTAYLHKAFAFVEYSRSMVLYENARLDNQLPPNLKAENVDLKNREAALIAKNNVEDLQNYLRLKRQFREKIKSLNRNQLASVATLQTTIVKDKQTAFIAFFVGDSTIFAFKLLQNDLKLLEIRKPKDFEQQIESFRQGITQAQPIREATAFVQQSTQLYALLLRGVCEEMPATISQYIIAPDGVLSYLPFELLIKTPATRLSDFRKADYLLKYYSISYAYSANLLLEQKRAKNDNPSQLFAGFASKYENKDTLVAVADVSRAVLTRDNAYELKGAKEEVAAISQIVGGKAFTDEFATEGVFKKEANQYRILHFAMHSLTNDKEPSLSKLLFTLTPKDTTNDNDLTAAELYTMQLNADLAVLSACNTGYGTIRNGEGVMSLARAFTYAGVPATVTSLWKVPDLTTREIMVEFYKNLKQGMTKDAALREAKLTYLKNAPESIAANPFFWAGFVPMGNMEAMDMSENTPFRIWGILGGLVLISALFFLFFKKRINFVKKN